MKTAGIWETGPGGSQQFCPTASPWPGSDFGGLGTVQLLIIVGRGLTAAFSSLLAGQGHELQILTLVQGSDAALGVWGGGWVLE